MQNCFDPPTWLLALGLMLFSIYTDAMGQTQESVEGRAAVTREQVRAAVNAHRAAQQEEVQRDEAIAGRRLTPAERAELREQLRREWTHRSTSVPAAPDLGLPAPSSNGARAGWNWRAFLPWSRPDEE